MSENLQEYINWLNENFKLNPIEETESILENAQQEYKADFDKWVSQYYSED